VLKHISFFIFTVFWVYRMRRFLMVICVVCMWTHSLTPHTQIRDLFKAGKKTQMGNREDNSKFP